MFSISQIQLETRKLKKNLCNSEAGGFVGFEGWVRNHNDEREVVRLEYECFETLAVKEGTKIIGEARDQFEILDAHCIHRIGKLEVGEMAVWVGVTARHRKAAFQACEYIINQVKSRVPIWKKECYADGESSWVNFPTCCEDIEQKVQVTV